MRDVVCCHIDEKKIYRLKIYYIYDVMTSDVLK